MRIKIQGEITVERLAEALRVATGRFPDSASPTFCGANLYLTVFNADGLPVELVDKSGQPVIIELAAPPGTVVRPPLTAEGAELRKQAKEANALQRAKEKAEAQQHRGKLEARAKAARKAWDTVNSITAQAMKGRADEFVGELNRIVHSVWDETKPVESMGKRKGEPRPLPTFSAQDGMLMLASPTWAAPRPVVNPVYSSKPNGEARRFWTHSAWAEACERMESMMLNWTKG
jgi:hypothetical protein